MTDRPESRFQSTPSPTRSRRKQAPPLLRRIRRNRFWLLLYLWLALTLPVLVLCHSCEYSAAPWTVPLLTLAPALTGFLLCTALPAPGGNYAVSLLFSASSFLFCGSQLVYYRILGQYFTLRSLRELVHVYRLENAVRAAILDSLPQLSAMGVPLVILVTVGRQLFSFRPLKRWQQHIPMALACVLSHLLVFLCIPPVQNRADAELLVVQAPPVTESVLSEPTVPLSPAQDGSPNQLDLDLSVQDEPEPIALLHRYFAGRIPSEKNGKTGLFRGCNLIQISARVSGQQEITQGSAPILHTLTHEGFLLTDYHVPSWNISSFDGDYSLLTGIVPTGGSGSLDAASHNYMPLTMAQQLISNGYSAWALHCCGDNGCAHGRYLEALGYECTLSTHQPRDAFDRWVDAFSRREPFTAYCSFDPVCELSQLDGALDLLLARLDSSDALKNTVIVLSLAFEDGSGLCVLWTPGTAPETVDAPASPLDLLPTLSNLLGLDFDSRLYMGRDVFSGAAPLVVLPEGSWITELAKYDAPSGKLTVLTEEPLPEGYADEITVEAQRRTAVSARILQEDYWAVLFP